MQRTRSAEAVVEKAKQKDRVNQLIRHRIRDCPYAYMFSRVDWSYDGDTLRLEGAVQSFYLKQVLQELLRGIEDVEQIVNHVNVDTQPARPWSRSHTGSNRRQPSAP